MRNARPLLPTPPNAGCGHQRPRDGEAELGGHLEVLKPTSQINAVKTFTTPHPHLPSIFFSSPFDKDDQISSSSTVSKRLLSNQSPPDTPSMREQVFYVSRRTLNAISSLHICYFSSLTDALITIVSLACCVSAVSPLLCLLW